MIDEQKIELLEELIDRNMEEGLPMTLAISLAEYEVFGEE